MFGAPLVRATIMHQQRRPNTSNLPSSSAIRTTVMANLASQSHNGSNQQSNGQAVNSQSQAAAIKPASKYIDVDPQMFIDSPFVGGATLSPASSHESTASRSKDSGKGKNDSFDLKFFNPSSDPRLFAM
ncbi:hypothetical protein RSOLAG1IB_06082 [Rhizoctonia solani AG-1 IB]|uniref:Uncharacterized protein n=1 Tax=Thanatephorus cucumeris (strain AG1-IB / isolate 7/3/14) TaxID=1108050 RepID=M5BUT7_THACB|nr:hypothetical protein BN14_04302 [Rhizoctonia solani AG-1 IB]CEL53014.1 hypothetical protein RSOLAG1IB_06082 [Rhizoctonia solani AG-1 IB]